MTKYSAWYIEEHSEYGHPPKVHPLIHTLEEWGWALGHDNRRSAEKVAETFADDAAKTDDLIDFRGRLTPQTYRLAVRPADLQSEPLVRVMVDVKLVRACEARYKFSEREWKRE